MARDTRVWYVLDKCIINSALYYIRESPKILMLASSSVVSYIDAKALHVNQGV
jgi:hypothetical protein